MSDDNKPNGKVLRLITQPGVAEILFTLRDHEGSATLAQIQAAGVADPAPQLRSLAAAGQLRLPCGTWDTDPTPETAVTLTATGHGLADALLKVDDWGRRNLRAVDPVPWWRRLVDWLNA